jgi:hypothetical protein
MVLQFVIHEDCPKCRKPITLAVIESHPDLEQAAVHTLRCGFCGFEKTKTFSIRPEPPNNGEN